jgi:hypothetical protein
MVMIDYTILVASQTIPSILHHFLPLFGAALIGGPFFKFLSSPAMDISLS